MARRILLVEDDAGLRLTLTHRLAGEGYEVEGASDGEEGLRRATDAGFDLVILDVMLPRMSGFDVCRELRRSALATPILILTARTQVVDRVVGLKLGADDYLTKPFEMAELLARVEARLRRRPEGAVLYRFGSVEVDLRATEVRRAGRRVDLSAKEFRLLRYFVTHRGATLGRDELLDGVWGRDAGAAHGRRPRRVAAPQAGGRRESAAVLPDGPRLRLQVPRVRTVAPARYS